MTRVNEQTPLLSAHGKAHPTPLPRLQFAIVLFLQLAEPLTSHVISPFAPQMVRDMGITHGRESQVGHYVGLLQSIFFVAEGLTVLFWSRLSDGIGRRLVIMTGLLGLSLSMFAFGLSKTFTGLVISRSLSGALNGNVGVMKSMVAEMTDDSNISTAYAYMPLAWNTGGTLGPMIGGWLYNPAKRFPNLFGQSEFHRNHPYFLPCALPATFSLSACIVTFLFLKETLPSPTPVLQYLGISKSSPHQESNAPSPTEGAHNSSNSVNKRKPLPLQSLFTRRVIMASGNYASLAAVEITFRSIQPLFYSTPIRLGGLGLSTAKIGNVLAVSSVMNGLFQAIVFARMNERFGSKKTFMFGVASTIPCIVMFPLLNFIAQHKGHGNFLWAGLGLQILFSLGIGLGYGAIFIFIAKASPNRECIGATNGISQTSVSIMRAIGPAVASSLFSLSIEKGILGGHLVYYVLITFVGIALYIASFLPHRLWDDTE